MPGPTLELNVSVSGLQSVTDLNTALDALERNVDKLDISPAGDLAGHLKGMATKSKTAMDEMQLVLTTGFAGLEEKLEKFSGNLTRSAVELAREWRTDKYLRRLEAMMIAADDKNTYLLSGNGDVIEPDDGVISIGSGSTAALAAAQALVAHTDLDTMTIVIEAMKIASALCIYTNNHITIEEINNE